MVARLSDAGVRFVVIGGVAMRANGSAHITTDLDVCYDASPANVRRLAQELARWSPYMRGVDRGLPFTMDERTFRITPVMTLVTDQGDLDVMDVVLGVGDYDAARAASWEFSEGGRVYRVLNLPALIAAKRAAGRPKDKLQLPELEALLARQRGRK